MSKRTTKATVPAGLIIAGLGLAALWMYKAGPNKRPSADGQAPGVSGNGPCSLDGTSLYKGAYC